jgi:hypothetical protein
MAAMLAELLPWLIMRYLDEISYTEDRASRERRIVFVIFDGFQPLDLVGPHEVFQYAGTLSGGYCCQAAARCAGPVESGSGLPVHATYGVADPHLRTPPGTPGWEAGVPARDPTDANALVPGRWCWHRQSARTPGTRITCCPASTPHVWGDP